MFDLKPAYNYYSSVYIPKNQTKYDSHKRSELKAVCSHIIKSNSRSPLFKVTLNGDTQDYAIGLKSSAIGLKNFSEFLSDQDANAFSKMTAVSSNSQSIGASVITTDYDQLPKSLSLTVNQLALNQKNTGSYVPAEKLTVAPGLHSFTVHIGEQNHSFHLKVNPEDDNLTVQSRLANFLNQADIGIDAYVEKSKNRCRLVMESDLTGTESAVNGTIFSMEDNPAETTGFDDASSRIVSAYHLHNTDQFPQDASFSVNGTDFVSSSNTIAINKIVEVSLHKTTTSPVTISFLPDTADVIDKMKEFAGSYNQIIDIASSQRNVQRGARKLLHEVNAITDRYHSSLEAVGLNINDSGRIVTDDALLTQSVLGGNIRQLFTDLSGFKNDLIKKTDEISMNPMNYVDKTVITYPNPKHTFSNPYVPSIYSGMLYNNYA